MLRGKVAGELGSVETAALIAEQESCDHCWHPIENWKRKERCCWCNLVHTKHGPHVD